MREFVPTPGGLGGARLALVPPDGNPHVAADGSSALANFVLREESNILRGQNPLPPELRAPSSVIESAGVQWTPLPGVAPALMNAFRDNTCNGCHATRGLPSFFMLDRDPVTQALVKASMLHPAGPEMARRSAVYWRALTAPCGRTPVDASGGHEPSACAPAWATPR